MDNGSTEINGLFKLASHRFRFSIQQLHRTEKSFFALSFASRIYLWFDLFIKTFSVATFFMSMDTHCNNSLCEYLPRPNKYNNKAAGLLTSEIKWGKKTKTDCIIKGGHMVFVYV